MSLDSAKAFIFVPGKVLSPTIAAKISDDDLFSLQERIEKEIRDLLSLSKKKRIENELVITKATIMLVLPRCFATRKLPQTCKPIAQALINLGVTGDGCMFYEKQVKQNHNVEGSQTEGFYVFFDEYITT